MVDFSKANPNFRVSFACEFAKQNSAYIVGDS